MTTETTEVVTTTPPAAAAPAPAPAPAPEVKPTDPPKGDDSSGIVEYEPIEGDPGLTMALQFVGKVGIGPDSPEMQAALKGDFSFLKATLASKGAAGYEHYIALAEKSWDKHVADSTDKQAKTAELIHTTVGGKESWEAIQKWAGENADPEEKNAINDMLGAGGLQARAAAMLLQHMHGAASGTTVNPASATAAAPQSGGAAPIGGALSPADFAKEVAALTNKLGTYAAGRSKEMEVLRTRRGQYRG